MKTLRFIAVIFLAAVAVFATSATQSSPLGPSKGNLVIVGGGRTGPEIWARFIALAGGVDNANVVVVPTAGESVPDDGKVPQTGTPAALARLGVKHVTVLHTSDRKVADSEEFVAPLKTATAVWFDGGRQWHLADSYLGTRTEKEFDAVLERGGVIGGSSAGATIQGEYLWRGDTSGPEKVEGDHTQGFAFLKGTAIDQHILVRNREFDLIPFIEKHPKLLGIGINESTAIVVHGNEFEVIGASFVAITDANQWKPGAESPNDAAQKGKIYFLGPGAKFDLRKRAIIPPRASEGNSAERRARGLAEFGTPYLVGYNSWCRGLDFASGFGRRRTIGLHPMDFGNLGDPTSVGFLLDLDLEDHFICSIRA